MTSLVSNSDVQASNYAWALFFCMACSYTWPYQAVMQAQTYYEVALDSSSLGLYVMMATTIPLILTNSIQIALFEKYAVSVTARVMTSCALAFATATVFVAQDVLGDRLTANQHCNIVVVLACLTALCESLSEPAMYSVAGLFPRGEPSQALMLGTAWCAVFVYLANVVCRLIAGGGQTKMELRTSARLFFALLIVISVVSAGLYFALVRHLKFLGIAFQVDRRDCKGEESASIETAPLTEELSDDEEPQKDSDIIAIQNKPLLDEQADLSPSDPDASNSVLDHKTHTGPKSKKPWMQRMKDVTRALAVPAACQFLVYFTTLAIWPTIPGNACKKGIFDSHAVSGWWFEIIIGAFVATDMLSRWRTEYLVRIASKINDTVTLRLALLRLLLIPAILYLIKAPQIESALSNWLIIVAILLLGLTNGSLATLTIMQGAIRMPTEAAADGANFLTLCFYSGLSCGTFCAWFITQYLIKIPLSC